MLIDTEKQIVYIPLDKIKKAINAVTFFLNKKNKKVTVLQVQKLCGLSNFLCRCVLPGRVFTTRLYAMAPAHLKQHHHVSISQENRLDLLLWQKFLQYPTMFCRPFMIPGVGFRGY